MTHGGHVFFYKTKIAKKLIDDMGEGLEWLLNQGRPST